MSTHAPANVVLAASSIGGIVEAFTVQPFDFVKTRLQLLKDQPQPKVFTELSTIIKNEGFFRLYRGCFPEVSGMIPKTMAMYSSYELSRRYMHSKLDSLESISSSNTNTGDHDYYKKHKFVRFIKQQGWFIAALAGINSGLFEALTVTPFQVSKVRLQSKIYLGQYKNTFDCYKQILRYEGITSLFLGLGPTIWRNCVWNGIYFGLMYEIKHNRLPETESKWINVIQTLLSGFIGGTIATCFNAPFDVVKSRFQEQLLFDANGNRLMRRYNYTLVSLYNIYLNEGLRGCYRGFEAKVIRMGIGGAVCMAAFEGTCLAYHHWFDFDYNVNQTEIKCNLV